MEDPDCTCLAAVDIGGTKVTASVSDEHGILAKVRQSTCLEGDEPAPSRARSTR